MKIALGLAALLGTTAVAGSNLDETARACDADLSLTGESNKAGKFEEQPVYGVDVSFPMQRMHVSKNYSSVPGEVDLGDRQKFHADYIQGCVKYYDEKSNKGYRCLDAENDRLKGNMRQPQGVYNYTELGYKKIKAPESIFNSLREFWEKNKDKKRVESWPEGNVYVNHWASPSYMVGIEDPGTEGGGYLLMDSIWTAATEILEEWTGQRLAECSLYGIRIYTEGAVLAPHADRLPLVTSAIINIDQDVDEPWPLEVIGHDGVAVNITMEPGDMVLYESHSILHGRPYSLKGRFMANAFVHFEPVGDLSEPFKIDSDLPKYVIRGTEAEENWRKDNPGGYKLRPSPLSTGFSLIHKACDAGDAHVADRLLNENKDLLNARDNNGWTPVHFAARRGHLDVLKVLMKHGANVNARTDGAGGRKDAGGTPLHWAVLYSKDNMVIDFLKEHGGQDLW